MRPSWKDYFEKTKGIPPRKLLSDVLKYVGDSIQEKTAIDLGFGAGQDTIALLTRGWDVVAIDNSSDAVDFLNNALALEEHTCKIIKEDFENLKELPTVTLLYASLSLPFCKSDKFPYLWQIISSSIVPGGWIAANFFGLEDDWVKKGGVTGHSEFEIRNLLSNFEIKQFDEVKEFGKTIRGGQKFWHLHSVIAQTKTKT